ncbi:MAG: ABC transporter permease [Nostocaceae cyanobacterium]|nr:ABC transporter permease [Nostocaceae cyanobacterium]
MLLNVLDHIGDRNPQVFRELKGRLNPRNILITGAASLLMQFIVFQSFNSQLPVEPPPDAFPREVYSAFCYITTNGCSRLADGSFDINWQFWWLHIFTWLSVIMLFLLLVGGTYLLINDLAKEEQRGTLNFLRLTPQPTQSLLMGKMLGVPILLYLFTAFTIPLHFWSGIAAEVSVKRILLSYALVIASCIFFYSAAMLFAFAASWLTGFQAWLGSGAVLGFLWISFAWLNSGYQIEYATAWLRLLSPLELTSYLLPFSKVYGYNSPSTLENLQFVKWNLGSNTLLATCLFFGNYALWTYWIWQGLNRCFRNPNTTIFSKKQSYGFVASCQVLCFGFALPSYGDGMFKVAFLNLLFFNFLLFLSLIAILLPHRQALYDWSRYHYQKANRGKSFWKSILDKDLLFSEKSPAMVAMIINLVIAAIPVLALLALSLLRGESYVKEYAKEFIFSAALFGSMMMIFATLVQRMLLLENSKRSLFATLTISSLIILPPILLMLMTINPFDHPNVWLFTAFPWIAIEKASTTAMFMALLSELTVIVLLNGNLQRQLRSSGESETKALISQ